MKSPIRSSKDFISGILFLAAGVAAIVLIRAHPMGTAMRMGPAYFPTMLGGLLALIGLTLMLRALLRSGVSLTGAPVNRLAFGKLGLVPASTMIFALLLRPLGLGGALFVLVVLSAYASERFRWPAAMALAGGLAIGSSFIFVRLLGLPFPILGSWLGG